MSSYLRKDRCGRFGLLASPDGIIDCRHPPPMAQLTKEIYMLKRRHIHAVWILLLAFVGVIQAQQAAPAQPKPRRFLMWKATSPTTSVYLVGSIHVGDSSMYPLPAEVESAFAA